MKTLKFTIIIIAMLLASCVSQKKYSDAENRAKLLEERSQFCENDLKLKQNEVLVLKTIGASFDGSGFSASIF